MVVHIPAKSKDQDLWTQAKIWSTRAPKAHQDDGSYGGGPTQQDSPERKLLRDDRGDRGGDDDFTAIAPHGTN